MAVSQTVGVPGHGVTASAAVTAAAANAPKEQLLQQLSVFLQAEVLSCCISKAR